MQQIAGWLEKLGLGQDAQRFAENPDTSEASPKSHFVPTLWLLCEFRLFLSERWHGKTLRPHRLRWLLLPLKELQ
jgi:hypothetical protein